MVFVEDKICLDSDFLIDYLRNKEEAVKWIKENINKNLATTTINIFELYYGEYKNGEETGILKLGKFLDNLTILNINPEIAKKSGENAAILEKQGKTLDFRDILIGTISTHYGYQLKTNNIKHFERIPDIKLI